MAFCTLFKDYYTPQGLSKPCLLISSLELGLKEEKVRKLVCKVQEVGGTYSQVQQI